MRGQQAWNQVDCVRKHEMGYLACTHQAFNLNGRGFWAAVGRMPWPWPTRAWGWDVAPPPAPGAGMSCSTVLLRSWWEGHLGSSMVRQTGQMQAAPAFPVPYAAAGRRGLCDWPGCQPKPQESSTPCTSRSSIRMRANSSARLQQAMCPPGLQLPVWRTHGRPFLLNWETFHSFFNASLGLKSLK